MSKTIFVDPFDLKEHKKASALIPEMTKKEWDDFLKNVKEVGIRQPLDINKYYEVLDGRHRLRAAKQLKLEKIEVRQHDLTEEEEMMFVRDTAIERRNLTPAQKHKVFTDAEDFIKSIYKEGRDNKTGRPPKKEKFGPKGPNIKKPHNSNQEIGKVIGASGTTVKRLNKIKKEDPELYEDVVKGDVAPTTAYGNLDSVKKNIGRGKGINKKDISKQKKTEKNDQPKKKSSGNLYDFKNPDLTKEETEKALFKGNVETIFRHLKEVDMFINRNSNYEDIVLSAIEKDEDTFMSYIDSLKKIIKITK